MKEDRTSTTPPDTSNVEHISVVNRIVQAVLERSGRTRIRDLCKEVGIDYSTLARWMGADPTLRELLSSARELKAEELMDQLEEYTDPEVVTTENYNAIRVLSDNIKWLIVKSAPLRYGDRIQQDIRADVQITPVINVSSSIVQPAQLIESKGIREDMPDN